QLPVNRPRAANVNTYAFDGAMAYEHSGDAPVYAPNTQGRPYSELTGPAEDGWEVDGELVRSAQTVRSEEDTDFYQAGVLVREVFDDAEREEFVKNVAGHLQDGVHGEVLQRAFQYWKNVDAEIGARIEAAYHEAVGQPDPGKEAGVAAATAHS